MGLIMSPTLDAGAFYFEAKPTDQIHPQALDRDARARLMTLSASLTGVAQATALP
jgi:hypothetical protein